MRWWLFVTVAAVALTACSDAAILGPDQGAKTETAGNTALFCRSWPEARRTVVNVIEGDESRFDWYDSALSLDQVMEENDRAVPVEIRADWDLVYDTYVRVSDLAFTTGFGESVLRTDHVEMMFGPAGADAVFARAMDGIEAIDDWSISACGDFCSRWLELEDAVMLGDQHNIIHGGPEEVERAIAQMESAIRAGNVLVPPALADAWDIAAALKSDFLDMWREHGVEGQFPQDEAGEQLFRDWLGMDSGEAHEAVEEFPVAVAAWVDANCASTASAEGAPGRLFVRMYPYEHISGRTVFAALLPIGTDFGAVTSSDDFVGAMCGEMFDSTEQLDEHVAWTTQEAVNAGVDPEAHLRQNWQWVDSILPLHGQGEYFEPSVCGLIRRELGEWIAPGGSYELFVGTYIGDPGAYELYFGAPERCAQITVSIDGNTTVDLPELEECDLEPFGSLEEIARRTAEPFEPGGTLRIELPSALSPEEFFGCQLSAVLLPVGTTLNDIGRGDAWPIGGLQTGLWPSRHIDDPVAVRMASENGLVPIVAVGPTGSPSQFHLRIEGDRAWDASLPDPVPLAAGSYDLILQQQCLLDESVEDPEEEDLDITCASVTVEVDGATVVRVPEFGACR
ncbi:MAG: hypothetical protein U9R51_00085 [Actinomycetota bacterium]|nr:hypothetical protein [Actinomycetota bacterium]